jgi:hypothetical protein
MSVTLFLSLLLTSATALKRVNRYFSTVYRDRYQLDNQLSTHDLDSNSLNERTEKFLSWANSVGIESPKCEVFLFPGGLRGLRAVEDIEEEEIFLKVPLRLCFTSQNLDLNFESNGASSDPNVLRPNSQNSHGVLSIPSSITEQFDWPVRLALRIIAESRLDNSLWAPYIATLPQPSSDDDGEFSDSLSYSLPVHWDDVRHIWCCFTDPFIQSIIETIIQCIFSHLLSNFMSKLLPD